MNRRILAVAAVVLIVAGIFAMSSLFIVNQTEEALVLQLGQPRRVIREPGLKVKRPFVENVIFYDNRLLDFEPPPEEVIVSDQKRLVVDTYTRYRITDPLLFYQTVSTEAAVRARLNAMVSGSLRRVLGNVTLSALLSHQRSAIMAQIRDEVSAQGKSFGINVIDVRIRRADLPEENSQAIFARMKSEREQQAAQYRGEGAEAAQTVRANAERERTVILAEAQRDAQKVRGDGDAQSIKTYADAFGQDKEFFAFYRSMQAYRDALNGHTTSFVLSPDSGFSAFSRIWTARQPSPHRQGGRRERRPVHDEPCHGSRPAHRSRPTTFRSMRDLWTALALVLVIEGALYALFPEGMKRAAARALAVPPQTLRLAGLAAACAGVVLVWLVRR